MQQKPLELRKVFSFSVESLQDNPETCFREIKEYLDMHSDKIEDFYFESYIDQETFAPIMVIHVIPNVEWRSKMMRNEIFENMLPAKILVSRIRQRLQNTMNNYLFEFNDTTTRKNMVSDIQKIITTPGKYPEVVDITDQAPAEAGAFRYLVRYNDHEMTLAEYLKVISED